MSDMLHPIRKLSPVVTFMTLLVLLACGTGPSSRDVTVTVSPSTASIPVHGSANLQGNASGFTAGPTVSWWIKESKDINFNADCGFLTSEPPPTDAVCPYGYVMFATVEGIPNLAVYHAPGTPGTYHVVMDASQMRGYGDILSVDAFATITVTP